MVAMLVVVTWLAKYQALTIFAHDKFYCITSFNLQDGDDSCISLVVRIYVTWCELAMLMQAVGSISRNIVSTVNLDCKLDLKAIALQARNAEYNPKVWYRCVL